MPKTKVQKESELKDLNAKLGDVKAIVFANFEGLKNSEINQLRKICRQNGVDYIVAKKTLLKKALAAANINDIDLDSASAGGIATILTTGDEVAPAKVAANFAKDHKSLKMLGGVMENQYIDLAQVEALSLIPSRPELLAKLVGSINAPVSGFVNVLAGNIRNLLNVLNALQKAKS